MGRVTSLFAHKVAAQVSPGVDVAPYLRKLGIDPDAPVDPKVMVDDQDYYHFLESLADIDPEGDSLALRTGASMQTDNYGAFGLAWKSALNLRGSCERSERYARILTSVAGYELEAGEGGSYMHLHRDGDRSQRGLCLSNEATMASMLALCREVSTADFTLEVLFLKHDGPEDTSVHEAHFGCPVHFNSDRDALFITDAMLDTPNRSGDAGIVSFFDKHLEEEIRQYEGEVSLERRVRDTVANVLSEGVPGISEVASQLGMSARSLQRKLAERGSSFQTLVDEARRDLAERLLRNTEFPLAEIAFLAGFSEQSAFNRAFKRWSGQTPRSFRLKA